MFSSWKAVGCAALVLSAAGSSLAQPANDFCSDPTIVQCGQTQSSSDGATGTSPGSCGASNDGKNVWFEFIAPTTGSYNINTGGSNFDTVLAIFTGCEGTELACNDDGLGVFGPSTVDVVLSSGQRVLIEVSSWANGSGGSILLTIGCPEEGECCQPWDNGRFDRRNAQTSQIGFGEDWRLVGRVTADDFWLCEGNIYRINSISGQLTTDSVVPKADVIILEDCDGLPGEVVAAAFSVTPTEIPESAECLLGEVTINETGQTTDDGFRIIDVRANWDRLFLKGGAYWVIIYGYSGTADPDEQFFWGTSGNQRVKGRPGQFSEFEVESGTLHWTSIDEICCGCTDFNFCVQGEQCKILLDNGLPRVETRGGGLAEYAIAGPSFSSQGNIATKVRTADQFVVPPCSDAYLCYIEAWVWTNCDTIRLELYSGDCHLPGESEPIATFTAECIFDTEIVRNLGGQDVTLRKAVFFGQGPGTMLGGNGGRGYRLEGGQNYWLSAYADGTGRQNGRGFFAFNSYCDRECWINFDPSATKGPPYATSLWRANSDDNAFLVAIHQVAEPIVGPPAGGSDPVCPGDFNRDGNATVQDLFDFLAAYFAGCP
ncbi:MAG: hypothetical protein IT438_10180 [Phycisphaerales bacterium]|nr:hypothetical protein [Phycisphaerales bacterium]